MFGCPDWAELNRRNWHERRSIRRENDWARLDQDGRISTLHILYDTAPLRASFEALGG